MGRGVLSEPHSCSEGVHRASHARSGLREGASEVHGAAQWGCRVASVVASAATALSHLRVHRGQDGRRDPNFCCEQVGGKRAERYSIGCLGK